jgi:Raf kinase inhibitor-like YbhB/YbcL family protein
MTTFSLTSPAFKDRETIPKEFTCVAEDISPELNWEGEPQGTKSFALIIVDPDAPGGDYIHWVIYNIPETVHQLSENFPKDPQLKNGSLQGMNHFGNIGYGGPCPPKPRTHCYVFTLYALNAILPLKPGVTEIELQRAMQGHVLASATLKGTFSQ